MGKFCGTVTTIQVLPGSANLIDGREVPLTSRQEKLALRYLK